MDIELKDYQVMQTCHFIGIDSQLLLSELDSHGICVSMGSACSSSSHESSHVLMALGLDHATAGASLRVTFGEDNTIEDVEYLINSVVLVVNQIRKI